MASLALLVGIAPNLAAQRYPGYPGTHLDIDVRVASIAHGGDSVRVTYVLANRATSEEQLFSFTVFSGPAVRNLTTPAPPRSWRASTLIGAQAVARWTALDDSVMTPGKASVPLGYTAAGLPGIVDARFKGWAEPPDVEGLADDDPRLTSRAEEVTSVPVKVVGVVAPLTDQTRAALLSRLLGLAQQTCTLGWTTDAKICTALDAYLRAPSPKLLAFLGAVVAARAQPGVINDNAYWLLRSNAEIARDFIDVPGIRLAYVCGNSFTIHSPNFVPVTVRYEVDGTTEGANVTLPGLFRDDDRPADARITTTAAGTVRLLYQGTVIQTVANGGVACPP